VVNDVLPAEGVVLNYRVLFNGGDIGYQRIRIREHDVAGHVVVEHDTKLEVRILFAVAYSLDHKSTEVWEGFTLKSVKSETVENDQRTLVDGRATDKGFRLDNQKSQWLTPGELVTADSFWIAAALEAASVVNTRTGDTAKPVLKKIGEDRWHLSAAFVHGAVAATLEFDNGFLREAEVDSDGHLVRLVRVTA
jgi:hypothetical protein